MSLEPFQKKLIQLYKDQELMMSNLYNKLADKFPKYSAEFSRLAAEELEHASWIDHLEQCIVNGKASFSEGKTRTYTITTMLNYTKGIIDALDRNEIDLRKAVSLIVDSEKSLIEKEIFERFEGDSQEVEKILRILDDTQKDHLARIEIFAAQVKSELESC